MSTLPEPVTHIVVAAWHCTSCDVQGRSLAAGMIRCWNCDGPVTVTAQPSIPVDEFEQATRWLLPHQRRSTESDDS